MNGEKIYDADEQSKRAALRPDEPTLSAQLIRAASPALSALPDGTYDFAVYDLIVDKSGRIVYYTLQPPSAHTEMIMMGDDPKQFEKRVEEKKRKKTSQPVPQSVVDQSLADIERTLDNIQVLPASNSGKAVIAKADYLIGGFGLIAVSVKDHKASAAITK